MKMCENKKYVYICSPKTTVLEPGGRGAGPSPATEKGEMPEWSIGPHSKCGVRATVPGVRIPLSPLVKPDKTGQQTDKSHKFNELWDFFYALWRTWRTSFRPKMTGFVTYLGKHGQTDPVRTVQSDPFKTA